MESPKSISDVAAINDVWKEYQASVNAGDAIRWASLWTEDGIQMQPGVAPIIGRQLISEGLAGAMNLFTYDQQITIIETIVSGDWAFSRGSWTSTLTPKGEGQAYFLDGKFMTVFMRQTDGSWKIHRDIMNSNTELFLTPISVD